MAKVERSQRLVETVKTAREGNAPQGTYQFGALGSLVGFGVRCMHQYLGAGVAAVVDKENLKPHQFTALSLIVDNPGISQRDVAEALGIKPSNMVPLIDELELRGLVKRNAAATNRRSYALTPSTAGEQLRDRAFALIARHENSLLDFLSNEERTLLAGMTHRLNALSRS